MEHQKPEEQMNHAKKDLRNNLQRQHKGLDPAAIERLLQAAEAFERAHPGLVFEDGAETLHPIREERMRQLEESMSRGEKS